MLIDSYIATRGTDFIDVRVISDHSGTVTIKVGQSEISELNPSYTIEGIYFYKHIQSALNPGKKIKVKISSADTGESLTLHSKTLAEPEGRHLCRFGILADLHLDSSETQGAIQRGRRLHGAASFLCEKYMARLAEQRCDFVVLPGDILDNGSTSSLKLAVETVSRSSVKCFPLIGNHEPYGMLEDDFYRGFGLPEGGYYAFTKGNYRFIFLSTPDQASLDEGTVQLAWLKDEFKAHGLDKDILLFCHFSFILHPCVQGPKNDGLQQIYNHHNLLKLFEEYPRIRAVFAGHKNVPSLVSRKGVSHILCPQLIQAPCAYDIVDVYEGGFVRMVHEIDEQELLWISRQFCGNRWKERFGTEESRCFAVNYGK